MLNEKRRSGAADRDSDNDSADYNFDLSDLVDSEQEELELKKILDEIQDEI